MVRIVKYAQHRNGTIYAVRLPNGRLMNCADGLPWTHTDKRFIKDEVVPRVEEWLKVTAKEDTCPSCK